MEAGRRSGEESTKQKEKQTDRNRREKMTKR